MRRFFSFLLMISMFCGAMAELKYVEISTKQNLPTIQIKSIDDFEKIINSYNISIIFLNNMERTGSEALVMTNGTYFSFPMEGYKTLQDYRAGKNAKFKQAENKSKEDVKVVYWTEHGKLFHTHDDCQALDRSDTLVTGSVAEAMDEGKRAGCKFCEKKQAANKSKEDVKIVYWTEHGKKFHTHEDCQALDRSDTLVTGSATEAMDAGKGTICKFCERMDSAALEVAKNTDVDNGIGGVENPIDTDAFSYMLYKIKKGDLIGKIAEQFEVTQDSIISVNNVRNSRMLQPGEYLKIPTKPGILYTVKKNGETIESITKERGVDSEKCMRANGIAALSLELKEGQTIFIPDARLSWSELQEINGDLFKKPIRTSWNKSSSFGWRENSLTGSREYHSGVDMACPTGTPVYAALSGKVIETGCNATYGNYIILQHASGYKTLYGHLSAIKTKRGAYVNQDSIIGKVGNTGISNEPHLHFEVSKGGTAVNPVVLWN